MLDEQRLIAAAKEARRNAHAPYSDFRVGEAVLTKTGKIFAGCNVENISLRLTLCAEEVAIGSAVAAGEKEFVAVAGVAGSKAPGMPCGGGRGIIAGI